MLDMLLQHGLYLSDKNFVMFFFKISENMPMPNMSV